MKMVNVFFSPALLLISFEEQVVENDFSVGQRLLKVYRHSDTSVSESLTLMNASQAFHLFGVDVSGPSRHSMSSSAKICGSKLHTSS